MKWLETFGFLADVMSHLNDLIIELRGVKQYFLFDSCFSENVTNF